MGINVIANGVAKFTHHTVGSFLATGINLLLYRPVVSMRRIRDPKSVRLKDRDYDVTPNIIAHMYPQIRNGSVKECEVEMVGEECEVYCEDGRRRVLVLTGHAGRVAPISPMLKRRISCGLEILN